MDLATTRRNLRQRLSVYRVDGCMPVPTATLTPLLDALDAAEAAVQRVRELHFDEYVEDEDRNRCYECGDDWPCATIRSIDDVMCSTCGEPHPCLTERSLDEEVTL